MYLYRLAQKEDEPPPSRNRPLYDIPYMFEAREFMRKKLIGKKVSTLNERERVEAILKQLLVIGNEMTLSNLNYATYMYYYMHEPLSGWGEFPKEMYNLP